MHRSEHDPTADEGTHIIDDGELAHPIDGDEAAPGTERMPQLAAPPAAGKARWARTVAIPNEDLKATVQSAGEELLALPADPVAGTGQAPAREREDSAGHGRSSSDRPRRAEPEPPTMRRPARKRRGPYLAGAAFCMVAGGLVAALWPDDGAAPPDPEDTPGAAPTTMTVPGESPGPVATPHAPPSASLPLVEGADTGDGAELAPYQGYLVVRSPRRAQVFEGQTSRGPTNRKLVLQCRGYAIRLRDPHTQRWLSAERQVEVACQSITTVVVSPESR